MAAKNRAQTVANALKRAGTEISLFKENEELHFSAVIMPVRDRTKQYLEPDQTSFGAFNRSFAVYYGPACNGGEKLAIGDSIEHVVDGGGRYLVRRCESAYLRGERIYIWAVLIKEETGDEAEWANTAEG